MLGTIFTIGYEGSQISDFVATLDEVGVDLLVDVRQLAASRRKGFSKNALAAALESANIAYTHLRKLGDPKAGRIAAREGRMKDFRRIYLEHFYSEEAQKEFFDLAGLAEEQTICLMCYEREPKDCHRSIVTDKLKGKFEIRVQHIGVRDGAAHEFRPSKRKNISTRQSFATPQ